MRITKLLEPENIALGISVLSEGDVTSQLVALIEKGERLNGKTGYKKGILVREVLGSTTVGERIATPHAKAAAARKSGLAAAVVPEGVDYEAFDDSLVNPIFMTATSEGRTDTHLEALSRLPILLMVPGLKDSLIAAKLKEEFLIIIDKVEKERLGETEETKAGNMDGAASTAGSKTAGNVGDVLKTGSAAVADGKNTSTGSSVAGYCALTITAYPTGVVRTFMAAENLENIGKKLGIPVKTETNGPGDAQNAPTKGEIASVDVIIIVTDKNTEMARFDGKPVIMTPVFEGIHKGEELVQRTVSGTIPVYHHAGSSDDGEVFGSNDSMGHVIYKHLTNGASHMPSLVTGGDALTAFVFLFDDYVTNPANFGRNTPLMTYLKTIGKQALGMILPVLVGYIAMSIADCPGLVVGFIGELAVRIGRTLANPVGGDTNARFLDVLFASFVDGYIIVLPRKYFNGLPRFLEGIEPMLLYPVLGIFLVSVTTVFIDPYVGTTNDALSSALNSMSDISHVVLGMVVVGMMSVDMGGPANKVAYVFGTAQLVKGNFEVMAAAVAGGMVPPIAITLCTTFSKNRFSERDRQSGLVNYVMGPFLAPEGTTPSVTVSPLRVTLSCVIGSAAAGGLPTLFNCTFRAPRNGIFILPTIGNPFAYLAVVLADSVVGCVILAILRKPYQA